MSVSGLVVARVEIGLDRAAEALYRPAGQGRRLGAAGT